MTIILVKLSRKRPHDHFSRVFLSNQPLHLIRILIDFSRNEINVQWTNSETTSIDFQFQGSKQVIMSISITIVTKKPINNKMLRHTIVDKLSNTGEPYHRDPLLYVRVSVIWSVLYLNNVTQ